MPTYSQRHAQSSRSTCSIAQQLEPTKGNIWLTNSAWDDSNTSTPYKSCNSSALPVRPQSAPVRRPLSALSDTSSHQPPQPLPTTSAKPQRPVSALVRTLVDAAGQRAIEQKENRHLLYKPTDLYEIFSQQSFISAEISRRSSIAGVPRWSMAHGDLLPGSEEGGASSIVPIEVTCEYDRNLQAGGIRGEHGPPVRPSQLNSVGPVAFVFRWYCKRAQEFLGNGPTWEDLQGSPPVPLAQQRTAKMLISRSGLSLEEDPVMSLREVVEVLEDLRVVPDLVRRSDVQQAFRLAAAAHPPANPDVLKKHAQPRPPEVRFIGFCDLLVRLALVVTPAGHGPTDTTDAPERIRALLRHMGMSSCNIHMLKNSLDEIKRLAKERGQRRSQMRWLYVSQEGAMQAGKASSACSFEGWSPLSTAPCPTGLLQVLLAHDSVAPVKYIPEWTKFEQPSINIGPIALGERRCFRVVLRNRSSYQVDAKVDTSNAPFASCLFRDEPLVPGMPRVVEMLVCFHEEGEQMGELRVLSRTMAPGEPGRTQSQSIPIFGFVVSDLASTKRPASRAVNRQALGATGGSLSTPTLPWSTRPHSTTSIASSSRPQSASMPCT